MKRLTEKQRIQWCYSFDASKRWLNAINIEGVGSRHTEREYSRALYTFCEWANKNPDQLITEAEQQAEDRLNAFCVWILEERKFTRTTLATKYHAPIKSFYERNGISLKSKTPKHTPRTIEPHTTEEIKALMDVASVRERAIITMLKDSGLSRQDVCKLTYEDIQEEFEDNKEFILIKTIRGKTLTAQHTFLGKNAVKHLRAYLKLRRNKGEKIAKNSPLIATLSGKPISPQVLSQMFSRLSEKVGFTTSPHRFRKFFETHLGLAVPSILVKYWMGHSLGVEKSYFFGQFTIEKQRSIYKDAYKEIDIYPQKLDEDALIIERLKYALRDVPREKREEVLKKVIPDLNVQKMAKADPEIEKLLAEQENEDCQKIVNESELGDWLAKGFRFIAKLNDNKVVVERNNH